MLFFNPSVLRAKVVGPPIRAAMPNRGGNYQVYWLRITSIFKGHANVQSKSLTKLYTPSQISSCRVRLQPSTEYLLFGKILGGNLYTSFCNFNQKWTAVTPEQRTGVEMQYSQGCKCKIGFCFANCGGLLSGCDGYDPHWRCRAKYHRCDSYRDRNGVEKCGWRGRGQGLFQQCARQGYGFPWVTKQFSKTFFFFFYLPTQTRSAIRQECTTCYGSKITTSLGKQKLELSTHTWSSHAPWNRAKSVCLPDSRDWIQQKKNNVKVILCSYL